MVQWLRSLVTLKEDLGLFPVPTMCLTAVSLVPRNLIPSIFYHLTSFQIKIQLLIGEA